MLTKAAKLLDISGEISTIPYADSKDIATWAKDAVNFVSSMEDHTNNKQIMGDTGGNKFSPHAEYTRQQAFITIKRLYM